MFFSLIWQHELFPIAALKPQLVTRIVPVVPDPVQPPLPIPEEVRSYTLSQVRDYLESADLGEARRQLGVHLAQANGQPAAESKDDAPAQTPARDKGQREQMQH